MQSDGRVQSLVSDLEGSCDGFKEFWKGSIYCNDFLWSHDHTGSGGLSIYLYILEKDINKVSGYTAWLDSVQWNRYIGNKKDVILS